MPSHKAGGSGGAHQHRAGSLRQSNKKNKRAKSSKRSVARATAGRINKPYAPGGKHQANSSKADRRNTNQQKRRTQQQQGPGGSSVNYGVPTPKVVGILSLGSRPELLEEQVRRFILSEADRVVVTHQQPDELSSSVSCHFQVHKKDGHLTLLTARSAFFPLAAHPPDVEDDTDHPADDDAHLMAALDLARVCDILIVLLHGNEPLPATDEPEGMVINMNDSTKSVSTKTSSAIRDRFDHLITRQGDRILTALKAQGLPTLLTVLAHDANGGAEDTIDADEDGMDHEEQMTMTSRKSIHRFRTKRTLELKKFVHRFATTEFGTGNDRVVEVMLPDNTEVMADDHIEHIGMDDCVVKSSKGGGATIQSKSSAASSAASLVRTLCSMSGSPPKWVAECPRPYLLSDRYEYDVHARLLHVTGFIRGNVPFSINSLVHVPGIGPLVCKSLKRAIPPLTRSYKNKPNAIVEVDMLEQDAGLIEPNPEMRESLDMFAVPNALEGEQNLIGFDDGGDDQTETGGPESMPVARPAGWSDYQSAWLDAIDDNIDLAEEEAVDHGELAAQLNTKNERGEDVDLEDMEISEDERRALVEQRRKEQKEDADFPDEVQINEDEKARERLARYRSLKSFRKSPWDPKENLPESYASIFHLSSFKLTQRTVMNEMKDMARAASKTGGEFWGCTPREDDEMIDEAEDDEDILEGCVPAGSYVTLTLQDVAEESLSSIRPASLLTVVSILPHENKVSVLHMGLSRTHDDETAEQVPVKSKDILTFRCGWRTWSGRPIFSQNNLNCEKHKFERFMPPSGAFFVATCFGPISYSPCPVMVFRDRHVLGRELVAAGTMIGADADRIVVKRILLTGYPVRVHKRHATVKYMFYNPDDVKWFKPAGLYTKHGLQGHITESVGDHGTMKCLFNAPIKQHDTVCLPLYKRVYPKYVEGPSAPSRNEKSDPSVATSKPYLSVR